MTDKEKILRWNLQEAYNECNKPIADVIGNFYLTSTAFVIMDNRRKAFEKCEKNLKHYLKNK